MRPYTPLKPARSDNYEVGINGDSEHLRAGLAAFYIKTMYELAVLANLNGRAVDQNIGETTRRGAKLRVDAAWAGGFSARLAYLHPRGRRAKLCHLHGCALPACAHDQRRPAAQ